MPLMPVDDGVSSIAPLSPFMASVEFVGLLIIENVGFIVVEGCCVGGVTEGVLEGLVDGT